MLNPLVSPGYQLYLFQIESYEPLRFLKLLFKRGLFKSQSLRKDLVWTNKARLFFVLATTANVFISVFTAKSLEISPIYTALSILVIYSVLGYFYFIFYILLWAVIYPVDFVLKKIVVLRAKSKISSLNSEVKVIGIAGSYGKTTMKEVLSAVLSSKYKVLSTPESVNTPVGISRWLLKNLNYDTQILILEMGEHYVGDISEICNLVKPDISVVTGINESHLERMGNLKNVISTIFEIVSGSKEAALVLLNADDKNVTEHFKEFVWPDQKVEKYQTSNLKFQMFDTENLSWKASDDYVGEVSVKLLGEYALADVDAAIKIGKSLGMSAEELKKGIENIKPVEHRLEPIPGAGNVLVIDDAYNGNPEGVAEAIKVLSRFSERRKVFITPGLVEMGKASKEVHLEIGKQLAEVVDVVVLVKNSVTPWIEQGIREDGSGKIKPQIIWFATAQEAHASLNKVLRPDDVVVFQNDWGDQYI